MIPHNHYLLSPDNDNPLIKTTPDHTGTELITDEARTDRKPCGISYCSINHSYIFNLYINPR